MEFLKSLVEPVKGTITLLIGPILAFFLPYHDYIQACFILVLGDIILGILAYSYEKYGTVHPYALIRAFRSTKLIKKFLLGLLFFAGLYLIDSAKVLLMELGLEALKAGKLWCVMYGVYELSSILENMGRLDFPVAKQFKMLIDKWSKEKGIDLQEDKDNANSK